MPSIAQEARISAANRVSELNRAWLVTCMQAGRSQTVRKIWKHRYDRGAMEAALEPLRLHEVMPGQMAGTPRGVDPRGGNRYAHMEHGQPLRMRVFVLSVEVGVVDVRIRVSELAAYCRPGTTPAPTTFGSSSYKNEYMQLMRASM